MNKKLVALLIPLLIMPLFAFGYAHFTDDVVKKYKIHVGSVYLNVTGFHVDYVKMPDVDNDGVIMGDELNVTIVEIDGIYYVLITADPISGGFVLNTTMWMHNAGKLPFELDWLNVRWDGKYDSDPGFDIAPTKLLSTLPMPPWSFSITVYKWHPNETTQVYERTGPWDPTETHYKPCDYIEVIQHVDFKQPGPGEEAYQKDWQCKWIKIWVPFHAQDVWTEGSSLTWGTLGPPR